jgi:hypothetical protein
MRQEYRTQSVVSRRREQESWAACEIEEEGERGSGLKEEKLSQRPKEFIYLEEKRRAGIDAREICGPEINLQKW